MAIGAFYPIIGMSEVLFDFQKYIWMLIPGSCSIDKLKDIVHSKIGNKKASKATEYF